MASYTQSSSLILSNTSYPISVPSTTFAPDTTMYCKLNDTVNFQVNAVQNAPFNQIGIASSATDSNPDPGNLGGSSTFSTGKTFTYTWTASSDPFTRWFFFNTGGGASFADSVSCVIRKVSVASLSIGSTTIAPGSSTTITANTIQGLEPPSGNNGHRLYLYVTDTSGNMLFGNGPTFSVSGNNTWLGKFTTTQTTNTMTVGSGVAAGDYILHVGHYGLGGSGNAFYGPDHRITSANFTVGTGGDTDPESFDLGSDRTSVSLNAQIQADQITVTGIDAAAQISVTGTSDGSGGILGSPRYSIAGGTYTSNDGTVDNNQTVDFRFDAPGSYDQSRTCGLSIGSGPGETDSIQVTTLTDPGGGGSTGGAGTGTNYGLEVRNPNGTVTIFGPNLRSSHIVRTGTSSSNSGTITPLNAGAFVDVGPVEGFAFNNASTITVFALATAAGTGSYGAYEINITRGSSSNGIGEGKFRVRNPSSSTNLNVTYFVVRY